MNILVYEYFSGGGSDQVFNAENLYSLGWGMLHACIEDCLDAGHQVCTLIDRRLQGKLSVACAVKLVSQGQSLSAFEEMLTEADAVLLIAPETGGTLSRLTSLVEHSGKLLLGSTTQATRIAGDKFASSLALVNHGCKVPSTALWPVAVEELGTPGPWILKPRSGAGCEGIYLTASPDAIHVSQEEYIIQEYVRGTAASVAMIAGKSNAMILSVNFQKMVFDPSPHYKGGTIPLIHPLSKAAMACARVVPLAIPGLRGYVGVDMVLTDQEVYIIEVNPRITFAYCGLRRVASKNLMKIIIRAAQGFDLQDEVHVAGSVQFDDFGRILEQLEA
jgi:predicted ATP-grasp superfamily ATP-dependent carboligase